MDSRQCTSLVIIRSNFVRLFVIYALLASSQSKEAPYDPTQPLHGNLSIFTTSLAPQERGGGSGFMNQHLKLLSFLCLAIYVRVDVVCIPRAYSRDTHDSLNPVWVPELASTLWDIESIGKLLSGHGIRMALAGGAAMCEPAGRQRWDGPPDNAMILPSFFARGTFVDVIAEDVQRRSRQHLAKLGRPTASHTIYAPDLLLTFNTTAWPLYTHVAEAVRFSPTVQTIANIMVARLLNTSAGGFNGLHLRLENDFLQTHNASIASELRSYNAAMRELQLRNLPLYVASGIFRRGGRVDSQRYSVVEAWLMDLVVFRQAASRIVNRQQLLRGAVRGAMRGSLLANHTRLHSEQRAAIDFLVMLQARQVVGPGMSSFSFALREWRALTRGASRDTTMLVGALEQFFEVAAGISEGVSEGVD